MAKAPDSRLSHRSWPHLVCYGALLAAAGLVFVLLFGNAGWALWDLRALEQVWPRLFPIRLPLQDIEGSASGPTSAVVTTAGYMASLPVRP